MRDYTRELMWKSIPGYSPTCDWHSRQSRSDDEILTSPSRPSELEGRHVASPLCHPRKVDLESTLGSSHRKEDQEEALATPPLLGILDLNSSCLNDPMEVPWGWCSSWGLVKAALMGWRAARLSSRPLPSIYRQSIPIWNVWRWLGFRFRDFRILKCLHIHNEVSWG